MEDFWEQLNNCKVFEKKFIKEYFSQQKKQALQKLTQSLNSAALRCLCKYWKWDLKLASLSEHYISFSEIYFL